MKKILVMMIVLVMALSITACGSNNSNVSKSSETASKTTADTESFPKFTGTDFEGNKVDDSIFKDNKLTVLNFWFNGCKACVDEISDLEEFNKKLKEKNAELVGVNVEANYSEETLNEAKKILQAKGATYRNIMIDESGEADKYLQNIMAFPTTVIVDENGNIIGEPIAGNINEDGTFDKILEMIDKETQK